MTQTHPSGPWASAATVIASPVGPLYVAATHAGLTQLLFSAEPADERAAATTHGAGGDIVREAELQLADYFAGRRCSFDLPLAPRGTEFQLATWRELRTIPYGATLSYGELARRLGKPGAARAVGAASAANPIPIVVPCHRVIGSDDSLVGYGGGLDIKRRLLALEGVELAGYRRPKCAHAAGVSTLLDRSSTSDGSLFAKMCNFRQQSLLV